MTDRVHPSTKPTTTTTTNGAATAANSSLPATKSQLYGANRPTYRPQQPYNHRSGRRGCCCTLFLCLLLTLLILLLLLGIAGTVVYLLYRPHRPSFSVTSLKLTTTPSSTSTLDSMFDLTVSTTNPNKKIVFSYEPISISILSGNVNIGNSNIPSFENEKKNTTVLRALVSSNMHYAMEGSMKEKNGLGLKVKMETKVEAKMGVLKTPRVGIRVLCDGITVTLPAAGKKKKMTAETATVEKAECAVDVRFKVWKWTVG